MNRPPAKVTAYLDKYSTSDRSIYPRQTKKYKTIIVIPAIAEYDNIKNCLLSLSENDNKYFGSTFIIIVVNNTASAGPDVKNNNGRTIGYLSEIINRSATDNESLKISNSGLHIAFIDASSEGSELSEKDGGVGLARKTGMDAALTLFDYDLPGKNILICLDADCTVSSSYITVITEFFNKFFVSAASINFEHNIDGDDKETYAVICYEIFLRYYVSGLFYASSPYAFHTIGSAMACDAESYIKNEGMNKRKAAEDFYFLEKLSKNYKIEFIKSAFVYPSGRSSWRVPFGTGQRITRFITGKQDEYLLFNPESFTILKEWLNCFSEGSSAPDDYLLKARNIHIELSNFLLNQNFIPDMKNIINNSTGNEQFNSQKRRWFDGFRTLKLIHHLRDTAFPLINMFDALDKLFIMTGTEIGIIHNNGIPSLEIQRKYLLYLRELENKRYT